MRPEDCRPTPSHSVSEDHVDSDADQFAALALQQAEAERLEAERLERERLMRLRALADLEAAVNLLPDMTFNLRNELDKIGCIRYLDELVKAGFADEVPYCTVLQ